MVRVLICDDQEIVREGLEKILAADPDIEVVGSAINGQEALLIISDSQPDLVLMDLKMPVLNGVLATRKIKEQYPEIRVLVLTTYDGDEWVFDAIRSGAEGYLLKDTPREDLVKAVKGTAAGGAYIDPAVAGKLLGNIAQQPSASKEVSTFNLSERETEVLHLLAQGLSNADIARQLFLSEGTVRNYTSSIFTILGVSDRTQAAVAALRYGLVNMKD